MIQLRRRKPATIKELKVVVEDVTRAVPVDKIRMGRTVAQWLPHWLYHTVVCWPSGDCCLPRGGCVRNRQSDLTQKGSVEQTYFGQRQQDPRGSHKCSEKNVMHASRQKGTT